MPFFMSSLVTLTLYFQFWIDSIKLSGHVVKAFWIYLHICIVAMQMTCMNNKIYRERVLSGFLFLSGHGGIFYDFRWLQGTGQPG